MGKQIWKPGNMLYPLPPVMISLCRPGEKPNIITAAWAGTVCTNPPMVSVGIRPERYSHDIIERTGEFVISLTTRKLVFAADFCGVRSGRDIDKFEYLHLTKEPSRLVKCPGIGESPVLLECRVREVKRLGLHDLFIADVVSVDVDDAYLDEKGRLALEKADLIAYSHGEYYALGDLLGKFGFSVRKDAPKKNARKKSFKKPVSGARSGQRKL